MNDNDKLFLVNLCRMIAVAKKNCNDNDAVLEMLLSAFDEDVLRKAIVIYYMGQGTYDSFDDGMQDVIERSYCFTREDCVRKFVQSAVVIEYFRKGLAKL